MIIIGVDYHPSDQYIAFVDTETGEYGERQLNHSEGDAERFYRELKQRGANVRVGMTQEDFDTMKLALAEEVAGKESALAAIDAEAETIELLTTGDERIEVQPSELWASAKLNERQTVQSVLFPEGVLYRPENGFFVPSGNELQAIVPKCLGEIADHQAAEEILDGRDDWI
jgi:hypothetical protein